MPSYPRVHLAQSSSPAERAASPGGNSAPRRDWSRPVAATRRFPRVSSRPAAPTGPPLPVRSAPR